MRGFKKQPKKAAGDELVAMRKDIGMLIRVMDDVTHIGDVLPDVPSAPDNCLFMFMSSTQPDGVPKVDLMRTVAGVVFTADGNVFGWPTRVPASYIGKPPMMAIRDCDYRKPLEDFAKEHPDQLDLLCSQIRSYSEKLYSYIEANMSPAGTGVS